jgi:hypothetical protein
MVDSDPSAIYIVKEMDYFQGLILTTIIVA